MKKNRKEYNVNMANIARTKLKSIDFGEHLGIHLHPFKDLSSAYIYRKIINDLLEDIRSTAVCVINKPNRGNNYKYDMFIYFEDALKANAIYKRLIELSEKLERNTIY